MRILIVVLFLYALITVTFFMSFQPAMVGTLARATRLPTIYVAHGGGPMPVLGDPGHAGLAASLKRLPKDIGVPNPTAILVVSAHWEVCAVPAL